MTTNFFSAFFEKTKNIFQIYFSNFFMLFGVPFVFFLGIQFANFLLLKIEFSSKILQILFLLPLTIVLFLSIITFPFIHSLTVLNENTKKKKISYLEILKKSIISSVSGLKTFGFSAFYLLAWPACALFISMLSYFLSPLLSQILISASIIFGVIWFIFRSLKSFFALHYAVYKNDFSLQSWKDSFKLTENKWWEIAWVLVKLTILTLCFRLIFFFGKLGMVFIVNQLPAELTPVFMQGYFLITQTFTFSFLTTIIFQYFLSLNKK